MHNSQFYTNLDDNELPILCDYIFKKLLQLVLLINRLDLTEDIS